MIRKICLSCFNKLYPHKMPSVWTSGRQCDECKRGPTSRECLVKIETDVTPPDVGVVPVDMRHK
jgi:hypothetical protein